MLTVSKNQKKKYDLEVFLDKPSPFALPLFMALFLDLWPQEHLSEADSMLFVLPVLLKCWTLSILLSALKEPWVINSLFTLCMPCNSRPIIIVFQSLVSCPFIKNIFFYFPGRYLQDLWTCHHCNTWRVDLYLSILLPQWKINECMHLGAETENPHFFS